MKYENGVKKIVMVSAQTDKPEEVESLPLNQTVIFLKAECDFTDLKDIASFYYSLDGKKWIKIGSQLKMAYTLPHFMGIVSDFSTMQQRQPEDMWTLTISVSAIRNKAIRNYKSIFI